MMLKDRIANSFSKIIEGVILQPEMIISIVLALKNIN